MPGQHAFLPPSGADGWILCPRWAWANAARDPSDDDETEWSAEGTAAHKIRERCLRNDSDPWDYIGEKIKIGRFTFEVTREMARHLQPGIDEIRSYIERDSFIAIEQRVYFDNWLPKGQFGSLDLGIVNRDMYILSDLKYGEGVPVSAEYNKQQIIYFCGLWAKYGKTRSKARKVRIIIDQPRNKEGGGVWDTTVEECLDFMENIAKPASRRVFLEPDKRVASEKGCRFCPERKSCVAYDAFIVNSSGIDFEDLDRLIELETFGLLGKPSHRILSPEQKAFIIRHKTLLVKWIEAMHAEAQSDAERGMPWPGTYLGLGKAPNREWKDEGKAERWLLRRIKEEDLFVTTMLSPAQAEKHLMKTEIEEMKKLWSQGEARPILAFEGAKSKRPRARTLIDEFDDESGVTNSDTRNRT